ncbi:MAG: hypothetical protein CO164_13835 [Rhodocyclales bacterium CG_4_9_14_3_um_filter_68_10]|nr:MAG: hypothetical protein CO164_13835 [Rhodocyclales bacterium CG_4_9_14_3_um_filter_68_10]
MFMSKLSARLGISTDTLQTAVDQTRLEIRDENLTSAVTSGDLTQEQADLLSRIEAYRETERSTETVEERLTEMEARRTAMQSLSGATVAERQAAMEQLSAEEHAEMAAALGVDVQTIEDTLAAARDAHIGGPGMGMGEGMGSSFGRGFGMGGRGMGGGRGMMNGGFGI